MLHPPCPKIAPLWRPFTHCSAFIDEATSVPHFELPAIRRRYLSTWFAPDIVSSIPVQIIFFIAPSTSNLISLKLVSAPEHATSDSAASAASAECGEGVL